MWVAACGSVMAAGGSDVLAGDVEEDASQLIFPKGEAWGRAIVPPFRVAAAERGFAPKPGGWRRGDQQGGGACGPGGPGPLGSVLGEGLLEPSAPLGGAPGGCGS